MKSSSRYPPKRLKNRKVNWGRRRAGSIIVSGEEGGWGQENTNELAFCGRSEEITKQQKQGRVNVKVKASWLVGTNPRSFSLYLSKMLFVTYIPNNIFRILPEHDVFGFIPILSFSTRIL